jgi:tetratricopeptide (TPR) repeat protein
MAGGQRKQAAGRAAPERRGGGIVAAPWFWPAVVFALALALRLAYVFQIRYSPFFQTLGLDARFYDEWARQLAAGTAKRGVFFMSPLYPYFLAGLYRLFGRDLLLVRVVQSFIGSATAVLVYFIARDAFDRRVGLLAGILAAAYGAFIFYDGAIILTPLLVFLTALVLLLLVRGASGGGVWLFGAAGAALGLAAIGRAAALALVPVALWWAWAVSGGRENGAGRRRGRRAAARAPRLRAPLLLLLGVVVVVAPVTVRNYAVGRDFVPITSNGGLNFYIGNSEISTGGYVKPEGLDIETDPDGARLAEGAVGRPLKPSEVSSWWYARARAFIARHPGAWGALLVRKLSFAMSSYELPQLENFYFQRRYSPLLSLPLPGFALIAPLGLVGLLLLLRTRRAAALLLLFFGAYVLSIVGFFVVARYRLPVVTTLIVGTAAGLVEGWDRARRGRLFRGAAWTIPVLAVLLVLVDANLYHIDRTKAFAQVHYRLGLIYGDRGDVESAAAEYQLAIEIDPSYPKSYLNLGALLAQSGRYEDAERVFRSALAIDPAYQAAKVNLGMALVGEGQMKEGIAELRAATRADTSDPMAWTELGVALYRAGRTDEARQAFAEASRRDADQAYAAEIRFYLVKMEEPGGPPLPPAALRAIARADSLRGAGRPKEAQDALLRAAELAPQSGRPLMELAVLKRDLGLTDEAIGLMRRALTVEPGVPQGHYILGVLLNEAGRHEEAIREYEAELALHPDDADAHLNLALTYQFYEANKNLATRHYREYLRLGGDPVPALEATLHEIYAPQQ